VYGYLATAGYLDNSEGGNSKYCSHQQPIQRGGKSVIHKRLFA
jgi:hypothetical protein